LDADVAHNINEKILEDCFESFVAAVYLDIGFEKCKKWLEILIDRASENISVNRFESSNKIKNKVKFWAKKKRMEIRVQFTVDNNKQHCCMLHMSGLLIGIGQGESRASAETAAFEDVAKQYFIG
jgi:ribonuclease-3